MKPSRIITVFVLVGLVGVLAWRWTRPPPPRPARAVPAGPHDGRVSALGPLLSGDVHGRIVRWTRAGDVASTWVAHEGALRAFAEVDGDLVSVAADSVARWGPGGEPRQRLRLKDQKLNDGVPVPGGVAVAGVRGSVAVLASDGVRWEARGAHGAAATAVWFDGEGLHSGGSDGRVVTWDAATGEVRRTCTLDLGVVIALVGDPAGVLVIARHGLARCRPTGSEVLATWRWRPTSAARLDALVVGTEDGVIEVRNPANGKVISSIDAGWPVLAVAIEDGHVVAGGRDDGTVARWPLP